MGSAIDDTRFSVYAVPAQGVSLPALEEAVDAALAALPAEALDADAIERAKTRLVAETIYSSDSQSSLARIYGSALAIGETLEEVRRWPAEIEAVPKADLASVAERFLIPRRAVTGYLCKTPG
jgi:zinc protease